MKRTHIISVLLSLVLVMSIVPADSVFAFDSNAKTIGEQLSTNSDSTKEMSEIVSDPERLADFVKNSTFKVSSKTLIFSKNSILSTSGNGTLTGKTENLTLVPLSDLAFLEAYNEVVEIRETASDTVVLMSSGGSSYKYLSDSSLIARLYSTVYYNTTTAGASSITKITGGITADGTGSYISSGVSITANYLNIGQVGANSAGSGVIQNDYKTFSNGTRSWTYYPPTSWVPVFVLYTGVIGCTYFVTLKRTTSWTTVLNNNPFSS